MFLVTRKFVLATLFMFFSASFVFAQNDDMNDDEDVSMPDVKQQIEEINSATEQAMLSGNYESLLQYYADDVISMPSYQPMVMGKEAMKENMMKDPNMGMEMTKFDINTKEVFSEGDLVVEIGTYELTLEMQGMPQPIDDHGKYLTIYEMQDDGSLKIKVETWNTNINPWEKMGSMDMDHEMKEDGMNGHDMKDMNKDKTDDTEEN